SVRALGQMLESGAHRDRVRVVAVVQEQTATAKLALLFPELRELDVQLVVRHRDPEMPRCGGRETGVRELMSRRVARRERERRLGVDSFDRDVRAVEVRLE